MTSSNNFFNPTRTDNSTIFAAFPQVNYILLPCNTVVTVIGDRFASTLGKLSLAEIRVYT